MNTFGHLFRLTSFGESHGTYMGGVIDGMPAGITVDMELLHQEMQRRRPGQSALTTRRKETDEPQLLSGIYQGKTTGAPIGFIIPNTNQRSTDYNELAELFRPSHADYTYHVKYHGNRDPRGGGRASARETVSRCVAGAFAKMALHSYGISIQAYTSQIGTIVLQEPYTSYDLSLTETNPVRCPNGQTAELMEELIQQTRKRCNSIGGAVTCIIQGCPIGLGEPIYDKLQASLASAMLSIGAAKGFEYGEGFNSPLTPGSEQNDVFIPGTNNTITTRTNHSGGIQGGISNAEDIYFRVAFKPVATILQSQQTVNLQGEPITFTAHGRHDVCIVPRAVPVVESMAAIVILDHYLLYKAFL